MLSSTVHALSMCMPCGVLPSARCRASGERLCNGAESMACERGAVCDCVRGRKRAREQLNCREAGCKGR
eukprot:15446611-Alexandrium_andersonii.AAC.1